MERKLYKVTFWRAANETELPINCDLRQAYSAGEAIRQATHSIGDWVGEIDHVTIRVIRQNP